MQPETIAATLPAHAGFVRRKASRGAFGPAAFLCACIAAAARSAVNDDSMNPIDPFFAGLLLLIVAELRQTRRENHGLPNIDILAGVFYFVAIMCFLIGAANAFRF